MIQRSNLLRYGAFLLLLGVFDFLTTSQSNPTPDGSVPILNDGHRQLLTDISSHRGYGTHYVTIMVGNPPQLLRLAVATGSDYTSFPCQGCYTCREPHFQYAAGTEHQCPSECLYAESTCRDDTGGCHLTISYTGKDDLNGEGYKGFEVTDYAYVDTSREIVDYHTDIAQAESFPLHFICQEESLSDAVLSDGYLGMSAAPLSFVNQLHKAKKINEPVFSLCFRQFDSYQPVGESAGHMTLGQIDRDLLDSPLVWAANHATPNSLSSYAVHIRRVYLGKGGHPNVLTAAATGTMSIMPIGGQDDGIDVNYAKINGELGHVLIQTNQPTSYLDSSIEKAFDSAFYSITGMHYISPYFKMTEEQYQQLPTIFIQIEAKHAGQNEHLIKQHIPGLVGKLDAEHPFDVLLAVPPEHYVIFLNELAFPTLRFGSQSRIASNLLQHHELVLDLSRDRIGLAERRHCPQGMSMMTPLVPAADAPRGPKPRSIGGHNSVQRPRSEDQPVEGVAEGETTSNGTVMVPENRDFVVTGSDLDIEKESGNDGSKRSSGGRTAGPSQGARSSSESGNAINAEIDDEESVNTGGSASGNVEETNPTPTTAGNGNAINAELDDAGRDSGRKKGRTAGGQPVGVGSSGGISPNFFPGESSRTSGEPLVEQETGLPQAQTSTSTHAVRIGPGAVSSEKALGDAFRKNQRTDQLANGYFNLIGFALFFFGFCVTLIFTEDSNALYAYIGRDSPSDETDGRKQPWKKGLQFYERGRQIRVVKKSGRKMKKGLLPKRRTGDIPDPSGIPQGKSDWVDDYTYMGDSYYEDERSHYPGDDRSYYARDDRSYYSGDNRTEASFDGRSYFTERPYYDSRKPTSQMDDSSGSYYQPYLEYEEKMGISKSERPLHSMSQRPYYDFSQRSARSLYSQKSFRSENSESEESAFDRAYKPPKAHFDAYDQSVVFNQSMASFVSEESDYVPKKADIRKFIKPVNADDRSVFTSSTGTKSELSKELPVTRSLQHSQSGRSIQKGVSTKTDFTCDTEYYSQYDYDARSYGDDFQSQGGSTAVRPRPDLERGASTMSEFTGADGTYYSSPYDNYASQSDLDYYGTQSGYGSRSDLDFRESQDQVGPLRGSHGESYNPGGRVSYQDSRLSSFRSLESAAREGSDHSGLPPTMLPPPSSAPHHPGAYQDEEDYSDVESFYVDEVSLAKFKGVRK